MASPPSLTNGTPSDCRADACVLRTAVWTLMPLGRAGRTRPLPWHVTAQGRPCGSNTRHGYADPCR
eukprot:14000113-Alexandrium_andersonii.AAC.1